MAVLVTLRLFKDVLEGTHIWTAIDNTSELSCRRDDSVLAVPCRREFSPCAMFLLIKCSSKKKRTAVIGSEVAEALRELNSSSYFDYIRTELNPGDFASRSDLLRSLQKTFEPEWRSPDASMTLTETWDVRFRQSLKRQNTITEFDRIFGGKRLKISTGQGPLGFRYLPL